MLVLLDGTYSLQSKLRSLCQSYLNSKLLLVTVNSVLPIPCIADPLVGHLKSISGKFWAQLKQTNVSWRQDLIAKKTSAINSAHPNTLKMLPGSSKTAAVCQPQLPVAGKAKLFLFSERCRWSCCRVGLDFVSSMENEGCWKVWGEAGMCNGAVGLQEVALEPDHSVDPHPLQHFQRRETLQPL